MTKNVDVVFKHIPVVGNVATLQGRKKEEGSRKKRKKERKKKGERKLIYVLITKAE